MVQGAINNALMRHLNNKCPFILFTGNPEDSMACSTVNNEDTTTHLHKIEEERLKAIINIEKLQDSLESMHR